MTDAPRAVAVWLHQHRHEAVAAAVTLVQSLADLGIAVHAPEPDLVALTAAGADVSPLRPDGGCEMAVIFGGDGSILRAAEWALPREVPLLGVNMGHVGFLADLDPSDTSVMAGAIHQRAYTVSSRLTLDVEVSDPDGATVWSSSAVNEISLEKLARERMIEVLVGIDGVSLSRWGCDGVLVSTPTGSTAYAFSAGGPLVWPDVEALLIVPLSAHALFNSPVVVGPQSRVSLTLVEGAVGEAVVWCDGRRSTAVQPGHVVKVGRGQHTLRLVRLANRSFTSRLVRKFGLRVEGWRGEAEGSSC